MGAENPLIPLVINAVHAVDAISTELGDRVASHVQAQRSVTQEMMGAIGRIVEQYYGSTPADALTSPMYQAILEQKLLGGWAAVRQFSWMYRHLVGPAVAAQLDEMADQYMDELDRHDENIAALARMHAPVVAGGAGEEPVLSLMAATSNAKTKRAWQRYRNSAFQKANYSWVTGDKKPLSWRVWNTGASTQEAIRKQLVESIRAGDSPKTLSTKLEQYLKPEFAPTQYLSNGKIVKKNIATGGGSYAARRLARTELTKTNGEWTATLVKDTPGALGTKWNLSGSHPAQDICDSKARGGSGKAPFIPGVYGPGNPPQYPAHPQCLCYLTPYMKTRQQVLDDLKKQYPTLNTPKQQLSHGIANALDDMGLGGTPERQKLLQELDRVLNILEQEGMLADVESAEIFGSFGTAKKVPGDLDIILNVKKLTPKHELWETTQIFEQNIKAWPKVSKDVEVFFMDDSQAYKDWKLSLEKTGMKKYGEEGKLKKINWKPSPSTSTTTTGSKLQPAQKTAGAKAKPAAKKPPKAKPFTASEFEQKFVKQYSADFQARMAAAHNGPELRQALASYKDGAYSEMNNLLRKGTTRHRSDAAVFEKLNALVEETYQYAEPIGRPLNVYRGTRSRTVFEEYAKLQPGDTIVDAGFVSTSTNKRVAHQSFGNGSYTTKMHIALPGETKGIWLDSIAPPREKELLLNKNATFLVKKVEVGQTSHSGLIEIFLEYIP